VQARENCNPQVCFPELIVVPQFDGQTEFVSKAFHRRNASDMDMWLVEVASFAEVRMSRVISLRIIN